MQPATLLSYNRYKSELYTITAPLTQDMYFKARNDPSSVIQQITEIHQKLLRWEEQLPAQLRMSTFMDRDIDIERNLTLRSFALQAFTLQAAYESMQLLLHRPLISVTQSGNTGFDRMVAGSREQCWISAMRLVQADRDPGILQMLEQTAPYTQWVSYAFNGGVMLAVLALTNIRSARTASCKQALAQLIKALRAGSARVEMCSQVCQVLTKLLHLVAAEEVNSMVSADANDLSEEAIDVPAFGAPVHPSPQHPVDSAVVGRHRPTPQNFHDSAIATADADSGRLRNWSDEFDLGDIGHSWIWDASFSIQ